MGAASFHRRDLQRIVLSALLVAALVLGGTSGLIAWATASVDRVEVDKERSLVERRLTRSLEGLVENVNSATIWNDSVVALSGAPDLEWLQLNFGDYYADYMHHAVTLTYGPDGRLIAASRNSEPVDASQEAVFAAAVAPMVAEIRKASAAPGKRRAFGFEAVVNRSAVMRVGSDVWLVAASSVVPEDGSVARPAVDPVVVSAQPIGILLTSLEQDLALVDPRFTTTAAEGPAVVRISGRGNVSLGSLVWTPAEPGRGLLRDAAPVMAAVLLALIAGSVLLLVWVDRVARRLSENEAALTEARDRAEIANVAKSRFLSNVSHELRTPLNGVIGMAEVMASGELSPIQRSRLDVLRESGANLLRLIERLLQVTRLERKEVLVDRAVFDPAASAQAMVDQYRPAAQAKGLDLTLDCVPTGPRLGDELHLQQVLDFLIDNAVTYTDRGRVSVEVSPRDGAVRFTIADTGMGIAPELLPRLFDVFVQGDDSITRRFEGAGLGLSICRNLVEAMGGRISVDSELGRGSTFIVDLPLPPPSDVIREPLAA
ncbi:sensor histidine kinase [Brevundimonas sp.]|uniref:sensor histidine kinase n=1 Tax=Brevundimonas sp. TaxID=1871086 RepID=UPI002FC91FF6